MKNYSKVIRIIGVAAWSFLWMTIPATARDNLVVSYMTPERTLYPHAAATNTESSIVMNIYDGLTDRDAYGKLVPGLATSWEMTSPTTWVFHLRQGVKWQNGDSFTAEDVAFTIEAGKSPLCRFKYIVDKIKEVQIVDPHRVKIVTKEPWPILPDALYSSLLVMSKKFCTGKDETYISEHPMGTGLYRVKDWVRENYLNLEAFEDHWAGPAPIKKVTLKTITNDATRLAGLITGDTDITMDVPLQFIGQLQKNQQIRLVSQEGPRMILLAMRLDKPEFLTYNQKVRQAVMLGVNIDEINQALMYGKAVPAAQLPASFMRGYNKDLVRPKYNPEQAKKLLAEAGYPNGFDITLHVPNNRYILDKEIGVAIAQQLSKIGIRVNLVARSYPIHFKEVNQHILDFYMLGWEENTYDSARLIAIFLKSGAMWGPGYSDPKFDAMLNAADSELDLTKRAEKLAAVNKYIFDNTLLIPLHYEPIIFGVSNKVKKFEPHNVKKILSLQRVSF